MPVIHSTYRIRIELHHVFFYSKETIHLFDGNVKLLLRLTISQRGIRFLAL